MQQSLRLQRDDPLSRLRGNVPSGRGSGWGEPTPLHDPQHPQHGLYAELKTVLPDYTSEQRLAQLTAALHGNGIRQGI